ncbi:LPS assembly lipoprotein LptE [Rhodopseudomonas sp. B29]|uniref:LPS assembly lipoprotein LptE n=1 Tax=Rhodopseudomonas sp. B29 TaxID=95607 RepID=UPI000349DDD3|nr:LPS assembly lipoprotein LptE [Rhodopseudomonas sp. B29]
MGARLLQRLALAVALSAPLAGCFHPMYADRGDGSPTLRDKLTAIEVPPLDVPNGSRNARIGIQIRNALMFKLYGAATGAPPLYRLTMTISTARSSLIVDNTTQLPTVENYGIDASYKLIEVATGKTVLTGNTFSRVEYDIPGQIQRFARTRAGRDAEDRASQEIAENINTRLASFFYAGI